MRCVSPARIHVRDSTGTIWEVEHADVRERKTRYSDYQGGDITAFAPSARTPLGEILLVPPVAEWGEGRVYDGRLTHPGGFLTWDDLS